MPTDPMKINASIILNNKGMPLFWQLFASMHFVLVTVLQFVTNPLWRHVLDLITVPFISIGVIAGFIHHKQRLYPWLFLIGATLLVAISVAVESLIFFGSKISPDIAFWIEESGILLIGVFGFSLMLLLENRYQIKGFTLDFSLLALSVLCFLVLLSPDFLKVFQESFSIHQQILMIHLGLAVILFSLAILNLKLAPKVQLKEVTLTLMIVFASIHFYLDALNSLDLIKNKELIKRISWSLFHLSGTLAIITIFIEKFKLEYITKATNKLGSQFLWHATIVALLAIPVGIFYRWQREYPPIAPTIIATASMVLSCIVIWRFRLLIKNSERQKKRLKEIAYTDSLTGLPNYLAYHTKNKDIQNLLVFSIDIEDFKSINDMHGRSFGDKVIKSLATRLQGIPDIIYTARTGSDSFLAVFQTQSENISAIAKTLRDKLGVWDTISSHRIAVPLTFGASYSEKAIKPDVLSRQAELALKTSREQHTWFTLYNENYTNKLPRHELREILQDAIDSNYLPIHFQPIYNLGDGSLKALELLIRVQSKQHGLLLPGQFLDQAKSYGMLTSLTHTCISMVAKQLPQLPDVTININVPPYMLKNPQVLDEFIGSFEKVGLHPKRFCIEVTEDGEIPTEQLIPAIELLRRHGFSISMDDFGTGYSSLGRLSVLPVDSVKIDRSLLLSASSGNKAILESAITLVKRLGVTAVVEGVETLEQLALIRELGADSVQGFLFSRPVEVKKENQFSLNAADIIAEF